MYSHLAVNLADGSFPVLMFAPLLGEMRLWPVWYETRWPTLPSEIWRLLLWKGSELLAAVRATIFDVVIVVFFAFFRVHLGRRGERADRDGDGVI